MTFRSLIDSQKYLEQVWILSNEDGQETTQQIIRQQVPNDRNAVWGCSGWNLLNLASLHPNIRHIGVFDISDRVQKLWEKTEQALTSPELNTGSLEKDYKQAIQAFHDLLRDDQDVVEWLNYEIVSRLSFLSSIERFATIQKIFQNRHFHFKKTNLGEPADVQAFIDEQQRFGARPFIVYISNIPDACIQIDPSLEGYRKLTHAVSLFPEDAILIDAPKKMQEYYATQRVTLPDPVALRRLPIIPNSFMITEALTTNDLIALSFYADHGADFHQKTTNGQTFLMGASFQGNLIAVQWLLTRNLDPKEGDCNGRTALHYCIQGINQYPSDHRVAIIRSLHAWGALVNAQTRQTKETPLHQAVRLGCLELTGLLIECGADATIQNHQGQTPEQLLDDEKSPVHHMDEPVKTQIRERLRQPSLLKTS